MTWYEEERLKKTILWRLISIMITLIATWVYTGSVKEASFFTLFLHAVLLTAHYVFEYLWEKRRL